MCHPAKLCVHLACSISVYALCLYHVEACQDTFSPSRIPIVNRDGVNKSMQFNTNFTILGIVH